MLDGGRVHGVHHATSERKNVSLTCLQTSFDNILRAFRCYASNEVQGKGS